MITSSTLENDDIQAFKNDNMKNDNVLYTQNDSIQDFKNDNIDTMKMITSSTLENDNLQAFKNDNIYS